MKPFGVTSILNKNLSVLTITFAVSYHFLKCLFYFIILFYVMCMSVCLVPIETRKGHWILWHWIYKWFEPPRGC